MSIAFTPFFPWAVIGALAGVALLLIGFGLARRARGTWWRTLGLGALLLALANPMLVEEQREPINDVAALVIDESPSQQIGDRASQTREAVAAIEQKLRAMPGLELRVIRAGDPTQSRGKGPTDGTRLFETINRTMADVPRRRMAGTIIVTDGQVHDVPDPAKVQLGGPVHAVLTGKPGETDRRLTVVSAPKYGIVGKEAEVRLRIEDQANPGAPAVITLTHGDGRQQTISATVGREELIKLTVEHAGPNIFEVSVAPAPDELTQVNNRTVVTINGVRERLRVLLVSGEPHPGERVWRNLLKADPSVDLVHFTILRPPEKQDQTPVRELSLIAFPIRQLFEVKLSEFDLIIFDRYRRRGVLPSLYLRNIANYVDKGGAVLEAAGPEFASPLSLARTPLGRILPGEPTGRVFEQRIKATPTADGLRHPITADLPGVDEPERRWGRWFRQIDVGARRGETLMNGVSNRPILIVDRVGKGRVAQLLTDHIWLWARGYDGGGPHSEMLRRLAHWLMKEPDLEENRLYAEREGDALVITRRSVKPDATPVEVVSPSGTVQSVTLQEGIGGRSTARIAVHETGLYRIRDWQHSTLAAVGTLNPLEYTDMRATDEPLKALAEATGGGIQWIANGIPDVRRVRAGRRTAGSNWLGLTANNEYTVTGVREAPLLPGLALFLLALGALLLAWRREGR